MIIDADRALHDSRPNGLAGVVLAALVAALETLRKRRRFNLQFCAQLFYLGCFPLLVRGKQLIHKKLRGRVALLAWTLLLQPPCAVSGLSNSPILELATSPT